MIVAVEDDRLDKPLLVPGVAPKLSRTPGRVPPLGRALGADTEAIRQRVDRVRADGDVAALRTTGTDGVLEGIGLSGE
jgi:crotonobetainyl-CoA:carnitine CoA-transferase CaiB-like acyl-CoA transferase